MSTEDSIKRFERIVAILIQLQSKRIVKAKEVADRFEVSLRTVYRDIRSLEAAGVPIYSEAGVGYSLVDGYKLPPIMFTQEEAGTFVAAEKLMKKFMDQSLGQHFSSAMYKIKSVLRDEQKEWFEAIDSNLKVSSGERLFNKSAPDVLEVLFEAIAEKKQVTLTYQAVDAEEITERNIEPVGVFHQNNNWYLLAYCHLRQDYRNFRVDRVHSISRTPTPFTREHPNLDYFLEKKEKPDQVAAIRLLVDRSAARFMRWDRKHFGFLTEKTVAGRVEMTFECDYRNNGFARWLMMFADQVDIVEPDDLRKEVIDLLGNISRRQLNK